MSLYQNIIGAKGHIRGNVALLSLWPLSCKRSCCQFD